MLTRRASARTHPAFGRFVWVLLLALGAGCATPDTAGTGGDEPAPRAPEEPVLEAGPIGNARQAEAAELYRDAEAAYEAGRAEEALRLTTRVVEEFPASAVSGRALGLQARAALGAGEEETAEAAAARYLSFVGPDHPRTTEMRLLRAEALSGRPEEVLGALADVAASAAPAERERAVALGREAAVNAAPEALETVLAEAPADAPIVPVLEARLAALSLRSGDDVRASELARAALDHGAAGDDAALAEAVLDGRVPDGYFTVRRLELAAILPLEGAPALAEFSGLVLEGIEVAAATALGPDFEVELEVHDDAGDPERTAALVEELEQEGVSGVVGFLEEAALDIAAGARDGNLPLISPTARSTSFRGSGVYTLEGVDSVGLHDLAVHAASRGFQRMAFVESTSALSEEEGDVFEREAARFGIRTVGRFSYTDGATFFEQQILAARDSLRAAEIEALGLTEDDTLHVEELEPVAVFVPVPAEDVELIAPQLTHFGLDTLGIEVLGTSGWTDSGTLRRVDPRHTNGVVATAPIGSGTDAPGYRRFEEAYEEHFQRSLVSSVPAAGYDAALLLLEAFRRGATGPSDMLDALEGVEEIEGATGVFSVVDGRVVRRTHVVRIRDRTLTPIP
ncbi:MAG: ABC transporter substrate-binding protein [Gemmatimonadota bacterium]|nr:ABC transporter substrate-binding protein [Gemmatimonadota bacterium]